MRDTDARVCHQVQIPVTYPYRMDHIHPFAQQPEVMGVLYK